MTDTTPGHRREIVNTRWPREPQPGDYWKTADGIWYAVTPNGAGPGSLEAHEVTEHEDGTITVSPSILMDTPNIAHWHGYLEHGAWREC